MGHPTLASGRLWQEANPAMSHADLRKQFGVVQQMVDSAMTKTAAEWQALLDATPTKETRPETTPKKEIENAVASSSSMPGLEQGIIKFTRKPAKMGTDFIFWIPRVYIKNGLVDPNVEDEITEWLFKATLLIRKKIA